MGIRDTFRKAMQNMIFPSGALSILKMPGTKFDFSGRVDGYQSAIIMACVNWIMRTFPEAPLYLRKRNADGSFDDVYEHPMLTLLEAPNPFYDGLLLSQAMIADLTIDGNAYYRKIRSAAGRVVELWWIPSPLIEPAWGQSTSEYITHYLYSPGGIQEKIAPEDIVHYRYGLDPNNIRKGLSPLKSLFREIFTDDEAANMTASLLRNLGVPGVIISPKEGSAGWNKEGAQNIKDRFKEQTTGDRRGEAMVMEGATTIEQFGFSPKQLDLKALRRIPEERISGVLGVPAIVAGLGAGLDRSTFSNMSEAREMAYESNIIPSQRSTGSVLKRQLLTDFEDDTTSWLVAYDIRDVRVLREDENKKAERVGKGVQAGFVTVADAQRETGMPVDETQNIYLRPLQLIEVPAGTKSAKPNALQSKSKGLDEDINTILWKRVDQERVAWWKVAEKRIAPMYEAEAIAVGKAIKGKAPDTMLAAAEKAIDGMQPDWEKMMSPLLAEIIVDFGGGIAEELGGTVKADWTFDPFSAAVRSWIKTEGTKDIVTILSTNLDDVKRVILAGVDDNLSSAELGRNLRSFYTDRSPFKAIRVARTEVTKASSFGSQEAARQSGIVKTKTWLTSRDERVRDEHVAMEGESVKLDENFSNGREFPDEPMCRCVMTFQVGGR